jgi:hypothetical protein
MSERTIPDPPAGMRYVTGPAPDPPQEGWWLDPDDPALMRYHNGEHWTERTTSSMVPLKGAKVARERTPLHSYFKGSELRVTLFILGVSGLGIAAILVPFVAPAFGRGSLAYEWTNRVGIFVLFSVLVPYQVIALQSAFQKHSDEEWSVGERVAMPFIGLVPLVICTVVLWHRLLEALWLR